MKKNSNTGPVLIKIYANCALFIECLDVQELFFRVIRQYEFWTLSNTNQLIGMVNCRVEI